MELLLASSSPQKKSLLNKLGLTFSMIDPEVDETPKKGEKPEFSAKRIANEKANKITKKNKESYVIAHHSLIEYNGKVIGQPKNEKEVEKALKALSSKQHEVIGVIVIAKGKEVVYEGIQRTQVNFKKLTNDQIKDYVKTGESLENKMVYFIQGDGGNLIESIEGSYFNIVGMPLLPLIRALRKIEMPVTDEVLQTVEMQEKSIKESFPR